MARIESGAKSGLSLSSRWVGANSLAELVGLGATFALDILILTRVAGACTALADAVVGAVHGVALVKLAGRPAEEGGVAGGV